MRLNGFLTALAVLGVFGAARPAMADLHCHKVHGLITFNYSASCPNSPVGVCTTGTFTKGGILNGTTAFNAEGAGPTSQPGVLAYTGTLVITTAHGILTLHD